MNNIYKALLKLMIVPVLLYVDATSGIADRIVVLDIGARKLQNDSRQTMTTFLDSGSLSYTSSGTSTKELTGCTGASCV
jgi:hypothetical protein